MSASTGTTSSASVYTTSAFWERLWRTAGTSTALDLYEKMLTLHPNRVNPGSLWGTAKAVKPS